MAISGCQNTSDSAAKIPVTNPPSDNEQVEQLSFVWTGAVNPGTYADLGDPENWSVDGEVATTLPTADDVASIGEDFEVYGNCDAGTLTNYGLIWAGVFTGTVINYGALSYEGSHSDTIYHGTVINHGEIGGGTFLSDVYEADGVIYGGIFTDAVILPGTP
jgi:hypothetical protein